MHGNIPLADVLTNSPLNLPIEISLVNSLAARLTSTNGATYTRLPVFVTVTGTLGNPQTKKDTLVLATLTAQAVTGILGGNSQAGNLIKSGTGLLQKLTGTAPGTTNADNTHNTNQPVSNLLNNLFR